ncbi:spermatid-specific linker histone H1-like protein [Hemicordylus capensis]|uniref:spermatid-specific linker histone H1-like protein n=1 Tax=Hemicordylus capensis TaxID=884348 RepID=UPI0023023682|nr:spermatid-specific linker histone H1-like protein [Hemicordylus capensis]
MVTINETPLVFSLNNAQCLDGGNLQAMSAEFLVPNLQNSKDLGEPQPSCSGFHLKPKPRSQPRSNGRRSSGPSYPWKLLLPKRGISKLIFQVVASTEKRAGVSLQALKKSVVATGYDLEKRENYFKRILRAFIAKGLLRKLTGHGLTGSYAVSKLMMKVLRKRQTKKTKKKKKKKKRKRKKKRRKRRARRRRRKIMSSVKKKGASKRKKGSRRKKTKLTKSKISSNESTMSST